MSNSLRWAGLLAAALLALPALAAPPARVIVKLKSDSSLAAADPRPQAAGSSAQAAGSSAPAGGTSAQPAAAGRAAALGRRVAMALRDGPAIAPRTQVVFADGIDAETLAARLAQDPEVEYATVDRRKRAYAIPNDPLFLAGPPEDRTTSTGGPVAGQWYLRRPDAVRRSAIDAQSAWDVSTGDSRVVVAVLDTGVRFDHPDLRRVEAGGNLLQGRDFVSDLPTANDGNGWDSDPSDPGDWLSEQDQRNNPDFRNCELTDSTWHGQQVAGLIAASTGNGVGMASVGRGVRLLPVRVLGKCGGFDSDIIAGMRWAAGLDVPGVPRNPDPAWVVNLSLGSSNACERAYRDVVAEMNAVGTVVVASAGNSAGGPVQSPANCPGVVGVAGLRHAGTKVGYSDMGPEISLAAPAGNCVDVTPGAPCQYPILTLFNSGLRGPVANASGGSTYTDAFGTETYGTSFAAPLVAGAAALMLSVQPFLTAEEVADGLRATTRPFPRSGADVPPGDPPVTQCRIDTPSEYQCYCTTGTCGTGMLDAWEAAKAARLQARIEVSQADPLPGDVVTFYADGSLTTGSRFISAVEWTLVDGGGAVTALVPGANGTATAQVNRYGRFTVQLRVTDSANQQSTVQLTLGRPAGGGGGSSGGGAASVGWLAALALAAAALRRRQR